MAKEEDRFQVLLYGNLPSGLMENPLHKSALGQTVPYQSPFMCCVINVGTVGHDALIAGDITMPYPFHTRQTAEYESETQQSCNRVTSIIPRTHNSSSTKRAERMVAHSARDRRKELESRIEKIMINSRRYRFYSINHCVCIGLCSNMCMCMCIGVLVASPPARIYINKRYFCQSLQC